MRRSLVLLVLMLVLTMDVGGFGILVLCFEAIVVRRK